MATYFHNSSDIQAAAASDGLQTLLLMNNPPGSYLGFSDTTQQPPPLPPGGGANFLILNSNSPGGAPPNSLNFPHAPPQSSQPQQLIGIPLASNPPVDSHHDISAFHGFVPRFQYNSLYGQNVELSDAREVPRAQQGLSLSLSSSQQPQRLTDTSCDDVRISTGESSMQKVLLSSKYLKAAQELLDEVVNVGKGVKSAGGESAKGAEGQGNDLDQERLSSETTVAGGGGKEQSGKRGGELSTAERQEIQMKKAKLVNMLDEVEQRYRQYHHQMQIVISWFEQAGGIGSAKTYTALALQTISKQFRCLKDAIVGQIRAASKSLGEEESLGGKIDGSRMKYVDNQLRQQRALQQLGMIQHNAWRPQRGLPERSVSVLRAWLFEHFLHPYPKDSDKLMLAKQTGLTRSQVSNWFINARVRLWKPMVEEMYSEEMKEQEKNGSEERSGKSEQHEDSASKATADPDKTSTMENQSKGYVLNQDLSINQNINSLAATSPAGVSTSYQSGFNLIRSPEMDNIAQGSPKKQRMPDMFHSPACVPSINMDTKSIDSETEHLSMKFDAERQNRDGFSLLGGPTNFIGGFGSYPIAELGRFSAEQFPAPYSGNGVSLTLGLPHCENLTMSGPHQTFLQNQNMQLARGVEIDDAHEYGSINTPTSNHSTSVYESINIQNRKGFSAQLLPDFVT